MPVAHEDDAERALRAALELVTEVGGAGRAGRGPRAGLRVGGGQRPGVRDHRSARPGHGGRRPGQHRGPDPVGGRPGQVWVDEATRASRRPRSASTTWVSTRSRARRSRCSCTAAGSVVAALGGLQRVDGLEAPLVGRDGSSDWSRSSSTPRRRPAPQLVVLDGEAGVGKSRLGWEFEKYIDGLSRTVRWHRGRCLSYGEGVAFWALAEAVRGRLGLLEDDAGVVVLEGWTSSSAALVPDGRSASGWGRGWPRCWPRRAVSSPGGPVRGVVTVLRAGRWRGPGRPADRRRPVHRRRAGGLPGVPRREREGRLLRAAAGAPRAAGTRPDSAVARRLPGAGRAVPTR